MTFSIIDVINNHNNVLNKDIDIIVLQRLQRHSWTKSNIKTRDLDTSFDTLSDLREQVLTNLRQLDYLLNSRKVIEWTCQQKGWDN